MHHVRKKTKPVYTNRNTRDLLASFEKTTPVVKFLIVTSESFYRDTDRCIVFKFTESWPM